MHLLPKTKAGKTQRQSKSNFAPYRLLRPILGNYRLQLFQAAMALLFAASATLILPMVVRMIADAGSLGQIALMQAGFGWLLLCAVCLGVGSAYRFYMVSWLGERVVSDIRKQLFSHLLKLPNAFFDQNQTGELLSRLTTDTTLVERVVGTSVSMALRNMLILVGALAMLFITSVKLAVLVLVVTPAAIVPVLWFARRYRALSKESQTYVALSSSVASGVLSVMDITKSYQYEMPAKAHFDKVVEQGFEASKRRIWARACLTVFIIVLIISAMVAVMWFGALEVLSVDSTLTAGQLGQFFMYAVFVATSVSSLSEVWGDLMRAAGALDRIITLLAEPEQIDSGKKTVGAFDISFDKVCFAYPRRIHLNVASGISFTAKPGQLTALVGQSGAGKSTLFKLLMRYYESNSGKISIGGVDISELSLMHLRDLISFVGHDAGIFPTSVKENLCMGRTYPEADMMEAAKQANIADFIDSLPDGYETELGERGVLLSAGQRQRIALARAILRDTPIVLLDEATNALDAVTEETISHALSDIFKDKTVLVIAHRLATVVHADQIVVIDHGEVESIGNHKKLCKSSEVYAKFAQIQLLY